jgi:CPA2 family monovalent cation:H+ antiporter-2
MEATGTLLADLALVLGMAAVTTVLCRLLKQPEVLGYLLAGLIVGPYVPIPLFADAERVSTLSELGVILVMFGIGLEFSVGKLLRVLPRTGIVAMLQIGTMLWLGFLGGQALGWSRLESMFVGAALCISSTMVVARLFSGRDEDGRVTELVFSVLVLQDFAAVILIAVLTAMASGAATGAGLPASAVAATVGKLIGFLVAGVAVGFLVVPRGVRAVARLNSPETLLVACIGLCFGLAELAHVSGFSVALGAFLAGSLVAESGEGHSVQRLVRPVRDMFAAIFFVTVGMQVDPASLADQPAAISLFVGLILAGQVVSVAIGGFLAGYGVRHAVQAATTLAQVGEFGFIMVGIGTAAGVVRPELFGIVVAVSAVTSALTPWLAGRGEALAAGVDRRLPHAIQTFASLYGSWLENLRGSDHRHSLAGVVRRSVLWLMLDASCLAGLIITASVADGPASRWLDRLADVPPWATRSLLILGTVGGCAPFVLGIGRLTRNLALVLARAALPFAPEGSADFAATPRRAYLLTVQLTVVLFVLVPVSALTQPFLPLVWSVSAVVLVLVVVAVLFWRGAADVASHARAGAEAIAEALSRHARGETPVEASKGRTDMDTVQELLPGLGTLLDLAIPEGSVVVGRNLRDVNLRGLTGATVFAIGRGEERIVAPDGTEPLRAGDRLCLAGTTAALGMATELLRERAPLDGPAPQAGATTAD